MRDVRDRLAKLGVDTSRGPAAICEFCDWHAQHLTHPTTTQELVQIGTFLRERIFAHMREKHPEKVEGPNAES